VCVIDQLDPCEVWRETLCRARKSHRCSCCRGLIRQGETYIVHFSVFEGNASSEKICSACLADREEFCREHINGQLCGPSFFSELLDECIAEGDPESERRWLPMRRARDERAMRAEGGSR